MPKLNTSLTSTQARFALWLDERMPYLLPLFNFENAEYLPEAVERYFGVASPGEAIMARFVLGVWLHKNRHGFDMLEAARVLDSRSMSIITEWAADPFWP